MFRTLLIAASSLCCTSPFSSASQQVDTTNRNLTPDKTLWVAMGGIGAGSVRVMSDGAIGRATINNNRFQPTGDLPGCFAAATVRSGNQVASRVIALRSAYGLPVTPGIDFDGVFPQAKLHCAAGSFADADVTLRAFSPFIPGDIRNSAMPAAAFIFHVVNRSASPITVAVALSWENTLGIGTTPAGTPFENRNGDAVASIPDSDGFFGLRFTGPEHIGRPSPGSAVDGASGDMTLLAHPYRNNAVVTTAGWNALDPKPSWWDSFSTLGLVSGAAPPGVQGKSHPAGVVAVQFVIKASESIDVPMCISWYTPVQRGANGDDYGHYYAAVFPDSTQVARALLTEWQSSLALTEEWQRRIIGSSMPTNLNRRIVASVSSLVTNSIFVHNGRFTLLPEPASGSESRNETYLRQRRDPSGLLLAMFPQLYAQEMVTLLAVRLKSGEFPPSATDWASRIGPVTTTVDSAEANDGNPLDLPNTLPVQQIIIPRVDAAALADTSAYVIQAGELVAASNDLEFVRHAIQNIRSVMMAFINHSAVNATPPPNGAPPMTKLTDSDLKLWIYALASARRLAEIAEDHAFEWAVQAGPLGSSPGGLVEIATEQHFVQQCDSEITRAEKELRKRGIPMETASSTTGIPLPPLLANNIANNVGLRQAADWELLNQIEGFRVNLQSGELDLTTPIPGSWRSLSAPVFSAAFVGRTEFNPTAHGGLLTVRIDRTITLNAVQGYRRRAGATGGPQLIIRTMRVAGPPPTNTPAQVGGSDIKSRPVNVHVSRGQNPIGCTVKLEPDGTLLLTFDSPVTLLTGDLLQVEVN